MVEHLKYLISSNVRYQLPLDIFLDSLLKTNKINPADIIVVVGESPAEYTAYIQGVEHLYVNHNSFDFTGVVTLAEQQKVEPVNYFVLHDTCKAGPEFAEKSLKLNGMVEDFISLWTNYYGMGILSHKVLIENAPLVTAWKNCSKGKAHTGERFFQSITGYKSCESMGIPEMGVTEFPAEDVYGTGTLRIPVYSYAVDLYKYVANTQGRFSVSP